MGNRKLSKRREFIEFTVLKPHRGKRTIILRYTILERLLCNFKWVTGKFKTYFTLAVQKFEFWEKIILHFHTLIFIKREGFGNSLRPNTKVFVA